MRRVTVLLLVVVFGVMVTSCAANPGPKINPRPANWTIYDGKLEAWNIYRGWMQPYFVEIEDSQRDHRWIRNVTLRPAGAEIWVHFSGWDFDEDGKWDQVGFCGYPETKNTCSAFYITRSGNRIKRQWDPERPDLKPFSRQELAFVEGQLDKAMATIHQPRFLVDTLESFRARLLR